MLHPWEKTNMRTLATIHPASEFRTFEEMFDRMFNGVARPTAPAANVLPLDVIERENKLIVRAAIPGIDPKDLDIQVEENVLTIRGEVRSEFEQKEDKVYRKEITTGRFSRSVRLPEDINLEAVDAEFQHGMVTVTLPRREAPKPKSVKVNVRSTGEPTTEVPVSEGEGNN